MAYSAIDKHGRDDDRVMAFVSGLAFGPLFYYAATYGVATAGAFGVIAVTRGARGGLYKNQRPRPGEPAFAAAGGLPRGLFFRSTAFSLGGLLRK